MYHEVSWQQPQYLYFARTDRCKLAFLGWACHAEGHLGRHAMRIPEGAVWFQKIFKTGAGLTPSS